MSSDAVICRGPIDTRCSRNSHPFAARGQLGNLRGGGGTGRDAREHVRRPAMLEPRCRCCHMRDHQVSPSIDTLMPRSSAGTPPVRSAWQPCVQPEARFPAVSRVNTYADPLLVSSSLSSYFARSPPCRRRSTRASRMSSAGRRPRSAWQPASSRRRVAVRRVARTRTPTRCWFHWRCPILPRSPSCRRRSSSASRTRGQLGRCRYLTPPSFVVCAPRRREICRLKWPVATARPGAPTNARSARTTSDARVQREWSRDEDERPRRIRDPGPSRRRRSRPSSRGGDLRAVFAPRGSARAIRAH